jgi:hypothetical protein
MPFAHFPYSEAKAALHALSYGTREPFDQLVRDRLGRDCMEAMVCIPSPAIGEIVIHWRSKDHPAQPANFWDEIHRSTLTRTTGLTLDLDPSEWSRDEAGRWHGRTGWETLAFARFTSVDTVCAT